MTPGAELARSVLLVVLGAWLGTLVASWVVAGVNFRTADRVASAEGEVAERLGAVPSPDRRLVFRHMAGEINRWMFRAWGPSQLVLGLVALSLAWAGGGSVRLLLGIALLIGIGQFGLSGAIVDLGRSVDFVPRPLPPDVGKRFGMLHAAYVLLDFAKAGGLLAVIVLTVRGR